ncbi:polysaccharide deacetylase family protein [Actinoallomurus spadix]|uniref:NodB homology domain-containing protein n=1 Tax=Actinoallomurus spadix TaxID=79912 RepID=A0ABN0WE22_9ACTN|nr:polysaccharide deacetylase family protein [Actinoallomurus spadix]MCO5987219.1 polysaccharide deacetylase family protein [Actinoallomurus spadix]
MRQLDRRQALWTFGAAGAGLVAGAVPEFLRGLGAPKAARHVRRPAPTSRPDPGYAHGRPLQALRRPIHSLHDLQPAAPPNAMALTIDDGHDRIAQVSGVTPKFFRSPSGAWSQRIIDVAAEHSMICIDWQVDPRDWARPGTTTITDRLLRAQAGDILLCHDGGGDRSETIRALRTVIPALKQRGLTFVAL